MIRFSPGNLRVPKWSRPVFMVAAGTTDYRKRYPEKIDVKMDGVWTIVKSYLADRRPIRIGDKVRARFRTGKDATNTCLDLYFELM